jgi:hypothetical protein
MAPRCNCDACVENPGLTCSYTGDDVTVQAVYVANAYRGNLILCPGGANGPIGGLLHQLRPPQHYSHMGIMLADHDLVRHCTAEPGWLTADEYYTGTILAFLHPPTGSTSTTSSTAGPGRSLSQQNRSSSLTDTEIR